MCTCARGCSRSHLGARACARRVRWIITSQCRHMTTQDPTAAPRTQLINLRRALESLDAGERGAWASAGLSPEARARAAQRAVASQRGRLGARGVAAAPTKKAAKITNTSLPTKKGGLPREKVARGRVKKVAIFSLPHNHATPLSRAGALHTEPLPRAFTHRQLPSPAAALEPRAVAASLEA